MLRRLARIPLRGWPRTFSTSASSLSQELSAADPEIFDIIEKEKRRQRESLCLIPSENFTSSAVLEALGSVMSNKYSEGYPNARYYGGNEFIDMAELTCQKRALETFRLPSEKWGVNVQSLSGSPANFEVYTAVLKPHERMMALDLPHGGHLSHGYQTATKKISAVSIYFECLPYRLDEKTGLIDYEVLERNAILYRPKLIVCGASAYSRHIDYARMRHIADINNSYLMTDMAHISGLVAAGVMPSPFDYSDIVTTTTHKSLRGPRGAMIFYKKGVRSTDKTGKITAYDLDETINQSVFPGHQGGPHNHTITALAVALKQAQSPEYKVYQQAVLDNSQAFCKRFQQKGYNIVSGGTDNHLFIIDIRNKGLNGAKVEKVLENCNIAINKNTVPGDKSALTPGGIRMGTPALTTRGFGANDFEKVADMLDQGIKIAMQVNEKAGVTSTLKAFNAALQEEMLNKKDIANLKVEVVNFARKFPVVGFNQNTMRYPEAGF